VANFSRRHFLLALSVSLTGLTLAGCPSPSTNNAGGTGTSSPPAGGEGKSSAPGTLRYALTAEPTTLDPALVKDGVTIDLLQGIYEGLIGWSDKNEIVPLVAAEMPKVSADGKVYTFTIRDGAKFHNGRQIVAEDVKYSITRSLDKNLASEVAMNYLDDIEGAKEFNAGSATEVTGIKVIDPKTVSITLKEPRGYFLGKLTYGTAYLVAKEEVEKGEKNGSGAYIINEKNVVGSGPYKLGAYTLKERAELDAFDGYWGGKPKLSKIIRPIVKETSAARQMYDVGDLDIVTLDKSDYENAKADPLIKDQVHLFDRASTFYLGINQTKYVAFKDKRVRQAIAHAIDKDAIVNKVLLGANTLAEGVLPKGIPGYDESFKGLLYDPELSKKLLKEAGFEGGKGLPPLTLHFRESQPDLSKTAQVVKEQLSAVGITVDLKETEWNTYLTENGKDEHDLFHMRWGADYLDPQNFLSLLLSSTGTENHVAYHNPEYDALCAAADKEVDAKKRIEMYQKAQAIVVDDAAWVPLYYQRDLELIKPWVKGLRDGLMGHLPHTTTTTE
jgi:oligopeptide transport system substrate-binding protein